MKPKPGAARDPAAGMVRIEPQECEPGVQVRVANGEWETLSCYYRPHVDAATIRAAIRYALKRAEEKGAPR